MPASQTIQVIVCEPGEQPVLKLIPSGLEGMQAVVGGMIELVRLGQFDLYCNEEGLMMELPFNRYVGRTPIVGTFFVCKADDEGNTLGLSDADVALVLKALS
jgi:hypothetical protein